MMLTEEVVCRYGVFQQELDEMKELAYRFLAKGNSDDACSPIVNTDVCVPIPRHRRFLQRFYSSFQRPFQWNCISLLTDIMFAEEQCRTKLLHNEQHELVEISRGYAEVLSTYIPELYFIHTLGPTEAEQVARVMIITDYYDMLLEACALLENLHRRSISYAEVPRERQLLESLEVTDWVESRQRQVDREKVLDAERLEMYRVDQRAYHEFIRQKQHQLFLFFHEELDDRLELERCERIKATALMDRFFSEHKEALYHQLQYDMSKQCLCAKASHAICVEEATQRSDVLFQQHDRFCVLQAMEVRDFLATRRNAIINEYAEEL